MSAGQILTFPDYCAIDAVNWSSLKHLWDGSPAHYRHHLATADKDTTGRMSGRLLHGLALGSFDEDFVIYEDGDRRGKAWEAFKAANPGKTIMKPSEVADVRAQAAAVHRHRVAHDLIAGAAVEQTVTWLDPETGIPCKGRLDALSFDRGYLADLKGCGGLSLLDRQSPRLGYLHQLAWYRRGVRVAYGTEVDAYLIGVETKAPHDVGVWKLDRDLLTLCEREIVGVMARLADCIQADRWPGRMPDLGEMLIPSWMISDELDIPDTGFEDSDERL